MWCKNAGFYLGLLEMMMRLTSMVMDLRNQSLLNGHGWLPRKLLKRWAVYLGLFFTSPCDVYLIYFHLPRRLISKNLYMRKHWNTLPPIYSQIQPLRHRFDQSPVYIIFPFLFGGYHAVPEPPIISHKVMEVCCYLITDGLFWSIIMPALDPHRLVII